MSTTKGILLTTVLLATAGVTQSRTIDPAYEVAAWPGFRSAAVSFTFDDGCSNQFAVAIPVFNEFGFKLTLFTITSWSPNWAVLQTAASQCHEIASHTVTHPSLGGLTLTDQTTELKGSQDDINAHVPQQACVTMAYPYCVTGNMPLCATYYIAARGCQGFTEPSTPGDFMNVSSVICGSLGSVKTAGDFNSRCEGAVSSKGWCVFLIHGIDNDGGYSPLSSASLRGALEYLNARRSKFWVATFGEVARYARQRNAVSVVESANDGTRITLHVTDTLDDAIFCCPLSLRRAMPRGWQSADASQGGDRLGVKVVEISSRKYLEFDVMPDACDILLSKAPAAPTGLTATAGRAAVGLDWSDSSDSGLAGYNVYRSTTLGTGYAKVNSDLLTSSAYRDVNVPHDTLSYYVVTTVDTSANESCTSSEVSGGLYGDLTGNGTVAMDDLAGFLNMWMLNDPNGGVGMDLDGDAAVSYPELAVLAVNWLKAPVPPVSKGCTINRRVLLTTGQ